MASTIKIKNSSTASAVPTSSDLVQGELAVNVTDKRIFTENSGGTVVELGTNPSSITLPDGSASAPTLTNDGDTNTGLFFPAADTVGITTGGTERARIDSSGNLGLGVTPSAWSGWGKVIDFGSNDATIAGGGAGGYGVYFLNNAYYNAGFKYKTTSAAAYYQQITGQHIWYNAASGTAGNAISFTQAMTLDASGRLGVGTTSPSSMLTVAGTITSTGSSNAIELAPSTTTAASYMRVTNGGSSFYVGRDSSSGTGFGSAYAALLWNSASTPILFATGDTERARIDSSGNLLVAKTALNAVTLGAELRNTGRVVSTMAASTNTDDSYELYSTGASTYRFYVGLGGTVYATNTTISSLSDIRFKENVRDLDAGLTEIMALKPRLYDWKEGKGADIKNARGFIAQEFEEVFPDLIDTWKETPPEGEDPYKSVRADLIPVLVKAIQEQQAIITTLTERITALEAK